MENKIQQLTEQLYNEGVVRGKEESEQLIAAAKEEAAKILSEATKNSADIVAKAEAEAAELKSKSLSELTRTLSEIVNDTKSQIEKAVTATTIGEDVKGAFADKKFVQELILASVSAWGSSSDEPIMVSVAADKEVETEKFIKSKVATALASKVSVGVSTKVKNGFTITPQDKGYYISFTAEDFDALLSESLRGKVSEILFGK
ncbi:MAG: hypothetical protein R3Y50_03200 [Rikenellaceae bacterium]